MAKIVEDGIVAVESLSPLGDGGDGLAGLGEGRTADGAALLVGFSPRNGGEAALAVVAHALAAGFEGEVVAIAPQWTPGARRLLGQLGPLPFDFRALAASALAEGEARVEAERIEAPPTARARQAAAGLGAAEQELFARAAAAFEGLAAKHGGSVRAVGRSLELVLLARRVAVLRTDGDQVVLETLQPDRATVPLRADELSTAMDRFEGALRKRLNDRRVRGSEEGLRGDLVLALPEQAGLRTSLRWPLGGSDPEVLDLLGVRADGAPVVAAVRTRLGLPGLSAILDAAARIQPLVPLLLAEAEPPARPEAPRLLLAASEWDSTALALLPVLSLACESYDVKPRRGREPVLERRELARVGAKAEAVRPAPDAAPSAPAAASAPAPPPAPAAEEGRERAGRAESRFEEISLFDVEDETATPAGEEAGGRRRRRSRGRRRGRRGAGTGSDAAEREAQAGPDAETETETEAEPEPEAEEREAPSGRGRGRRRRRGRGPAREVAAVAAVSDDDEDDGDDELDLGLAPMDEDVPDLEVESRPGYDEEEEDEEEGAEEAAESRASEEAPAAEEAPEKPRPRRRAAIVAHADRDSILTAIVLARDVRLVEGFWIYPQEDLMTFFRGVATDLREDTPIWLVGFQASPAIDTIQAAALYQGRLGWFDHHEWPPEDLERMRQSIGADNLVVHPGAGSSLPGVLAACTRRSRFSDKLVELGTGRFSEHDYERWGRLWWQRLGDLAGKRGEHRRDLDPLLAGRPSDLAREAARAEVPALPSEVEHVSSRDYRLVHFAGYTLCVVPVPRALDLHLCARIARERYDADISLALHEERELIVLAVDDSRGRRGIDVGRLVDHLASKHDWIDPLPNDDHVARMRVRGLARVAESPDQEAFNQERLDEVIREIAMSRSALEA